MKTAVILSLLVATSAVGARLEVAPDARAEVVQSPRKAQVLRAARAAFALPDGSQWVTHPVHPKRETSAVAVTRFGADGSADVYLVSDWLPKGTIPRGWCGQVYAVTQLTDSRVAVSAGWTDGSNSHNAILVLRATGDRRYKTDKVIRVPGVSQIVAGHRNSILAITNDASRRGGGPLLTVFTAAGEAIASGYDQARPISAAEAAQYAMKARLQRIGERRFAIYFPLDETVHVLDIEIRGPREATVTPIQNVFVGDEAALAAAPVLGIDGSASGDVVVVRVGQIRGTPGTQLTVYGRDSAVKQSVTLDRPWRLLLNEQRDYERVRQERGRLRGLLLRDSVALDSVAIRD